METIPGGSKVFDAPARVVSPPSDEDVRREATSRQYMQVPTKEKRRAESAILGANETDETDDGMEEDLRYRNGPMLTSLDERDAERNRWNQRTGDSSAQATPRPPGRTGHYSTTSMGSRVNLDTTRSGNQALADGNLRYRGGDSSVTGSASGIGMASANGFVPTRRVGALNARGTDSR
jgi:hypothetical protein